MIVDINEIERCLRYFKELNNTPLSEIVWTRGGEVLSASNEEIQEFEYMGLSNRDFPSVVGWMPDDVGIRVSTIALTAAPPTETDDDRHERLEREHMGDPEKLTGIYAAPGAGK